MAGLPHSSLVIGVATSAAERVQLARLLGGADVVLLVSSADQAREFLELAGSAAPAVVLKPDSAASRASHGAPSPDQPDPDGFTGASVAELDGEPATRQPPPGPRAGSHPSGLVLDADRRVARWQDREAGLTRLEHDLLQCLISEPGEVWTYERLHLAVWGNAHLGHGSHLHSVVKRLRRKLAQLGTTATIRAVRGVGFHLPA